MAPTPPTHPLHLNVDFFHSVPPYFGNSVYWLISQSPSPRKEETVPHSHKEVRTHSSEGFLSRYLSDTLRSVNFAPMYAKRKLRNYLPGAGNSICLRKH